MPLILHSEPRPPTGGVGATGALNSLGRPNLDFWSLYVRETLQNCWDARRVGSEETIGVAFELRQFTDDQLRFLTDEVFFDLPEDDRTDHWRRLTSDRTIVTITDRGTTGMGGPTRADTADPAVHDFADFVWNVGQPPDKDLGGGTYGYGKSVHYLASRAHTILVHTVCATGQGLESRLIGCAWGEEFSAQHEGRLTPHTGRHWWGTEAPDRKLPVAPAIGEEAERIASELGMPRLDGTGTSIMILAADVTDGSTWGRTVADAVAWHCWPKLVDLGEGPEMAVEVRVGHEPVPVPDPASHPELSQLVSCLAAIDGRSDEGLVHMLPIALQKPATQTGRLAMRRLMDRPPADPSPARPFEGPLRHVALMRGPRLVVRYLQGPDPPAPFAGWAGVFVAEDEHDRAFAKAEPPAHDDWVPRAVEQKAAKRIVNVTLRRIAEAVRDFVAPTTPPHDGAGGGLGALADRLGGLLPVGGPGPVERFEGGGSGGGRSSRKSRASVDRHRLEGSAEGLVLVAEVTVTLRDRVEAAVLTMDVDVATSDGTGVERDAPEGAPLPRLLGWEDPGGGWNPAPAVKVSRGRLEGWRARISVPRDTAVVLRPHCRENGDG